MFPVVRKRLQAAMEALELQLVSSYRRRRPLLSMKRGVTIKHIAYIAKYPRV